MAPKGAKRKVVKRNQEGERKVNWQQELEQLPSWPVSTLANSLILLTLVLIVFSDLLLRPEQVVWGSDLLRIHASNRLFQVEHQSSGWGVSFWDPTALLGRSVLGDPITRILNPVSQLIVWGSGLNVLGFQYIIVIYLSLLGMYLWMRDLGLTQFGGFLAAVGYGLSGRTASHLFAGHLELLSTAVLIPWVFLTLGRCIAKPTCWRLAQFSLVILFVAAQGNVQYLYYTFTLLIPYSVGLWWLRAEREASLQIGTVLKRGGTAIGCGLAVMSIWWMPVVRQNLMLSARGSEIDYTYATFLSLGVGDIPRLLVPFFGVTRLPGPMMGDAATGFFWETASYPTAVIAVLGLCGFALGWRDRMIRLTAVLMVSSVLLALGKHSPFYWTLYEVLPGMDLFRVPGRFMYFANLALGMSCAMLLSRKLESKERGIIAGALCMTGLVLWIMWFTGYMGADDNVPLIAYPALGCSVAGLAGVVYYFVPELLKVWRLVVAGCVIVEVLVVWNALLYVFPERILLPENPVAKSIVTHGAGTYRVLDTQGVVPQHVAAQYGLEIVGGYNPGIYQDTLDLYRRIWREDRSDITELELHPAEDIACEQLLDTLNIGYIVSDHQLPKTTYVEIFHGSAHEGGPESFVYWRGTAVPRVYLTPELRRQQDTEELMRVLCDNDPRTAALTTEAADFRGGGAYRPLEDLSGSAEEIQVKVDTNQGAVLVVSQSWHPDWTARVNGNSTPVLRVNRGQIGILLEPGEHDVVIRYVPRDLYLGMGVSATTLIALMIGCGLSWWRLRKDARHGAAHRLDGMVEAE